jgi:DNA-binding LytR/AlgR family response regulator
MENKIQQYERRGYFVVITKQGTTKLMIEDILFFEKELRRIHVQTIHGRYSYYGTFRSLQAVIDQDFFQCHASYIVNLAKIIRLERYLIYLEGGEKILVSQRKYPKTKERYHRYIKENFSCNIKDHIV